MLVCPSLEAPSLSLLGKVGWSGPPPCWSLPWEGQPRRVPLPPWVSASTIWVHSLCSPAGALPPPPLAPLHLSLSSRFHLRKSSLQLSRNLLLSALPMGSTVLGSVFLWEGRVGPGWGLVCGAGGRRLPHPVLGHRSWGHGPFPFFLVSLSFGVKSEHEHLCPCPENLALWEAREESPSASSQQLSQPSVCSM